MISKHIIYFLRMIKEIQEQILHFLIFREFQKGIMVQMKLLEHHYDSQVMQQDITVVICTGVTKGYHDTDEITRTSLRVPSDAALDYWMKRFNRLNVKHQGIQEQFGKKILPFVDFDDQQYQLISDANNTGVDSG